MRGQPYPIGLLMFMIASVLLHSCGGTEAYYDVVVVGGGAGGTSAGIQSARSGASVLIVEETPWLGGMLTSALTQRRPSGPSNVSRQPSSSFSARTQPVSIARSLSDRLHAGGHL